MRTETLEALPEIVAARALLDEALVNTREIAVDEVPAEPVADALSEALRLVYAALAALRDAEAFRVARDEAVERVRDALARLQSGGVDDPAVDAVAQGAARALRLLLVAPMPVLDPAPALPRARDPRAPARATLDEPRLLDLQRDVLRPMVPLPTHPPSEPPERITEVPSPPAPDLDALAEEARASLRALDADDARETPPPAPAPAPPYDPERVTRGAFGERLTAMDVLFDHARGCLEDLGALGLARRPMEHESWWCPRTEARLLARIDALAACGEAVVPWLVRLLEERPVPDPELTWATVLLFGCVAGDDALDQAMRVARVTPLDEPALREALGDALTHAPHPGLAAELAPWLEDPSPGRREVALVALGRRGALTTAQLARHLDDRDAGVVRAAVNALADTSDAVPEAMLAPMVAHPDATVAGAALDALARRGSDLAVTRAAELVRAGDPDRADAAMHVAIGAGDDGLAVLHGVGDVTPVRAEALGWYGHAASAAVLLKALTFDHEATVAAAARALWTLTGAPITDDDPSPEPEVEPFARATWDDDALPECPEELSVDPAPWSAWWARYGARASTDERWRFGRRWRAGDAVRVLAAQSSRPRERRWAAMELVARTGRRLPLDAWRFIPRQLEQIAAWREAVAGRGYAGPWVVAGERR